MSSVSEDNKFAKIFNRIVRWTESGLEYESDPIQIKDIIFDLVLEGAKTVGTAGVKLDAGKSLVDQLLGW